MWLILLFGGAVLGIWMDNRYFSCILFNVWFHLATIVPGVLLFWAVMRISKNTGRLLAREGRVGDLPRMQTNKLVTRGVYACMRHPMHLGLMFFPLSLALLIGSLTFIIIIAPLEMLFMVIMIKLVEEPEAIRKFGSDYRKYMMRVPMFNLRWRCLKQLLKNS
jgi:protein-S-isoprenylcysteine O-methyltransferase Ste14